MEYFTIRQGVFLQKRSCHKIGTGLLRFRLSGDLDVVELPVWNRIMAACIEIRFHFSQAKPKAAEELACALCKLFLDGFTVGTNDKECTLYLYTLENAMLCSCLWATMKCLVFKAVIDIAYWHSIATMYRRKIDKRRTFFQAVCVIFQAPNNWHKSHKEDDYAKKEDIKRIRSKEILQSVKII